MGFGLGHGRTLDDAPGVVGLTPSELPPLPDAIITDPEAGRLDPRAWFTDQPGAARRPFDIEIGCGKGGFIVQEAAAAPDVNILGIEVAREFYLYTADRVRRRGLRNVRMMHGDAGDFLKWRCPAGVVRRIHLYYSDPWPKTKHHKNRVVQHEFLASAWRALEPGGELRVVTDHDELWAWCEKHFDAWCAGPEQGVPPHPRRGVSAWPAFERRAFDAPAWAEEGETVGTNYERKFTGGDKKPHACVLVKRTG